MLRRKCSCNAEAGSNRPRHCWAGALHYSGHLRRNGGTDRRGLAAAANALASDAQLFMHLDSAVISLIHAETTLRRGVSVSRGREHRHVGSCFPPPFFSHHSPLTSQLSAAVPIVPCNPHLSLRISLIHYTLPLHSLHLPGRRRHVSTPVSARRVKWRNLPPPHCPTDDHSSTRSSLFHQRSWIVDPEGRDMVCRGLSGCTSEPVNQPVTEWVAG